MLKALRVTLVLTPLLLLAHAYVAWKLYLALTAHFPWPEDLVKRGLLIGVGYLNLHALLLVILSALRATKVTRVVSNGHKLWDWLLGYPYWFGLVWVIELLPWLVAIDFIKLPFYPLYKEFKPTWSQLELRVILVVFALLTVYVLAKVVLDTVRIRVSQTVLTYRNLPFSLDGLKMVHISDLQADSRTGQLRIKRLLRKIRKLQPNLVFFSGDLITHDTRLLDFAAAALAQTGASYGCFACLGDHDVWTDKQAVVDALQARGVFVLEDANRFVRVGNESLLVTFITNVYDHRPNLDRLNFLMGQQPRGVLDILLTHQPSESIIELAAERGYHIFLAGHTHGGQIVFNLFGLTVAAPRLESPYYRGTQHVGRMLVSVNSGLGFTLAPIRYNAPAEIRLIKLIRQPV